MPNRSVTVISPASGHGGPERGDSDGRQRAAKRDVPEDLPRRGVQQGRFFEFPFDVGQSEADDQHDPRQGRHGMDPNGPGPTFQQRRAETGQRVPALQPEAGLPRRRLEIQRHEEHQPQQRQPQPPAQQIGANQQPRQQRPQRHAHRADGPGEPEGVQEQE